MVRDSVNSVVVWIVSGLWGGYTASNVLKWYWWRFNGFGYFWGMVTGIGSALVLAFPGLLDKLPIVQSFEARYPVNLEVTIIFPLVLVISLIGCLLGTLLTKPESDEILMDFYRRVRPWGFWGPVLKKVLAEDPGFKRNKDFPRDMFNIVVGIVWQVSLVVLPLVRRDSGVLAGGHRPGGGSGDFSDFEVHLVRPFKRARGEDPVLSGAILGNNILGKTDEELKSCDSGHEVIRENPLAHKREGMALFGGNFHETIYG